MADSGVFLSPRLATVADCVLPGRPLADIGTDHAYLPVALVAAGRVPTAIATDVNQRPAAGARATVAAAGLTASIAVRVGSGLATLTVGEAATIVIAGMGGRLIRDILAQGQATAAAAARLVLQPMRDQVTVRRWLWANGWRLVDELLAQEGEHLYTIIVAEPAPSGAGHAGTVAQATAIAARIGVPEALVTALGPLVLTKPEPLAATLVARELAEAEGVLARLAALGHDGRGRRALLEAEVRQLKRIAAWLVIH